VPGIGSRTAECATLTTQWDTAEAANPTHNKLPKAKSGADKAKVNCESEKTLLKKNGISQYKAALKLLGVTPAM
jgi:hypothetical protein